MTSRTPDRIRVSTRAYEHAHLVIRKFPEFGSIGLVHRVAALLSLRRNGVQSDRPKGIDSSNDHPARLPGAIELSEGNRPLLLFPTIIQLLANRPLDLEEIYEQVWFHIHLGTFLLWEIADQSIDFDDFFARLKNEIPAGFADQTTWQEPDNATADGSGLYLGLDRMGNEVLWKLTDTSTVENPHACIVGLSGQGKTQFALDLLYQLRLQNSDLSFTVLDYKGDLSEPGSATRRMFDNHLGCDVAVPGRSRIPAVPFHRPQAYGHEQYALSVTDLISRFYPQLGTQQRLALREVLVDVMSGEGNVDAFGFEVLGERLERYYNDNRRREDGLTEVISRLRVLQLFEETPSDHNAGSLLSNSLLVRLNELAADTLPAAFLLISRLYDEMRRLPDAPRVGSVIELRHVIFIDEAHHYLSERSSPLARIIREGRSKGVAVFLATQSVSDLAGAAGADYREFLSNSFFFKTNLRSHTDIRAMVPAAARRVQDVANVVAELGSGEMLFTKNLGHDLRSSVLSATQYYQRNART